MFCDITKLTLKAGDGGNGCISFRREKYIPNGGPDGGNGGKGGDVIIQVNTHLNSLEKHHSRRKYAADKGSFGEGWKKNGANAEDLILEVPQGTVVKDAQSKEIIADLSEENSSAIVVVGGRGGYGNEHFKSSTRQAPKFAELGEPGEERDVILELKLVADVGIIGLPSAGKSTLISVLTACKPKIADYPFTTLIPNLGVAKFYDNTLVIADIPGLIEGASEGKGLGDEFLRHISRNSVLVHVIDVQRDDPVEAYNTIQKELEAYGEGLADKKQIIALNKLDTEDKELESMLVEDFRRDAKIDKKVSVFCISAAAKRGLDPLLQAMWTLVEEEKNQIQSKKQEDMPEEKVIYTPLEEEENSRYYEIEELQNDDDAKLLESEEIRSQYIHAAENDAPRRFIIKGKRINQIAIMTDFQNSEGVYRLWDVMKKLGVWNELERKGAKEGDYIGFERFSGVLMYREKL